MSLKKEETVIIIYQKQEGDDYFSLDIRKKYPTYVGGFTGELAFQAELDTLQIELDYEEYFYHGEMNEIELQAELIRRGFQVDILP